MRTRALLVPVSILALLAPGWAWGTCPGWKVGPFVNYILAAPNGANATIGASTFWSPPGGSSELVVSGGFTSIQGTTAYGIAARDGNTGKWSALGSGISGQVIAMTTYNNDLIVAGTVENAGGVAVNYIAGYNGSSWYALGGGITGAVYVRCLCVYNGELIVGGTFSTAGGAPAENIAAWDGSSWHPLGSGVSGEYVIGMTVWNGQLYVGGVFTQAGGVSVNNVAMWDGSTWHAVGSGVTTGAISAFQPYNGLLYALSTDKIFNWNGTTWSTSPTFSNTSLNAITAVTGTMYVAGSATTGGGGATNGVFTFDGTNLHGLGNPGITGTTLAITILNNDLVAMGSFSTADGRTAKNIALWDGTTWCQFGGGVCSNVQALTTYNGRTVAGGDFHLSLATMPEAHDVIGWDGATSYSYGTGMDGPVDAFKTYLTGIGINHTSFLVAGGTFAHADGNAASNIARWSTSTIVYNPSTWSPMGAGLNGQVSAIERFNNVVYAGGSFTASGGTSVPYLGSYNETSQTWSAPGGGMNGPVYALKVYNGYLYAGGAFTSAGGVSTGGLARWNGTSWSACGGYFGGTVNALEIHNGVLVMAGSFPGFGGSPNISSYDGTSYANLGTGGTNAVVRVLHSTGARLYAGGDFTSLGGVGVTRLGYWNGAAWNDADGGADNSIYALSNTQNFVDVGGTFTNVNYGSFVGSAKWARFDETGIPEFAQQPSSATASAGDNVSFTAVPDTGYSGLTMRWYRNGVALSDGATGTGSTLSGTTSEVLDVMNVGTADLGGYDMVVTEGSCGSDTSLTATLSGTAGVGDGGSTATVFDAMGPNPSPGTTHLQFTLARAARVGLAVRDVAGRLVRSVDVGTLPAGHHEAAWDARDAAGQRVSAGVYFVGLEIDGRLLTARRLAIVR